MKKAMLEMTKISPLISGNDLKALLRRTRVKRSRWEFEGRFRLFYREKGELLSFSLDEIWERMFGGENEEGEKENPQSVMAAIGYMIDERQKAKALFCDKDWRAKNAGTQEFLELLVKRQIAPSLVLRWHTAEERQLFTDMCAPLRGFSFRASDFILESMAPAGCWLSQDSDGRVIWKNPVDPTCIFPFHRQLARYELASFLGRWTPRLFWGLSKIYVQERGYEILGEADDGLEWVSDDDVVAIDPISGEYVTQSLRVA